MVKERQTSQNAKSMLNRPRNLLPICISGAGGLEGLLKQSAAAVYSSGLSEPLRQGVFAFDGEGNKLLDGIVKRVLSDVGDRTFMPARPNTLA
jgi:hypothetical protein